MKKLIIPILCIPALVYLLPARPVKVSTPTVASTQAAESTQVANVVTIPEPQPETIVEPVQQVQEVPEPQAAVTNEQIAWAFFINRGYSKIATAGILGNLQQEHGFQTSDVSGGLGIAQWTGSRRAILISRGNYEDIYVQLEYLASELDTGFSEVKSNLTNATSVEEATVIFQNGFERCGICMEGNRIQYAQDIYSRY